MSSRPAKVLNMPNHLGVTRTGNRLLPRSRMVGRARPSGGGAWKWINFGNWASFWRFPSRRWFTGAWLGRPAAGLRRRACSALQFRLRDLMILSILACIVGGAISIAQQVRQPQHPYGILYDLLDLRYTSWYEDGFWYFSITGCPGIFFIAAGLPLALLLWFLAGEWLQEHGCKRPLPKPVDLAWLSESIPRIPSRESAQAAAAYPSLLWVVAGCGREGWLPEAMPNCQLIFTYAAPPLWPAANHGGSPGERVETAMLALEPAESGCSPTQKERID